MGIILCNNEGRVFWAKRVGVNSWQFPQGGINPNEDPETAMYRELWEETGLQQQQESNSTGRAGTEIYKSRTLEDINLIYSTQTLVSTRQEEGWPSGSNPASPTMFQMRCWIIVQ